MIDEYTLLPLDLWRAGPPSGQALFEPRIAPHPNPDVAVFVQSGQVWVRSQKFPERGMSLWDGPMPQVVRDWWWVIPKGTPIPKGLIVIKAKKAHRSGYWHHTLVPEQDMPMVHYQALLRTLMPYAELKHACS